MVDYAVAKMEEALNAQYAGLDAALARMRQRKQELDLELKRLTDSIAQGQQSQSIMKAIGDREKELRVITDKLLEPAPGSLRAKLEELREFAVSRLSKIRELLARPENIQEAHEALAERIGQLTLQATNENGKKTYLAHGKVDFFGEEELAHSDGAGGQTCTILPQAMFFVDLAAFCLSGPFRSPPAVAVLGSTEPKISGFAETSG